MGWNQPKESEGKRTEATGNQRFNPVDQVNRVGAKFQQQNAVNPAYAKGAAGKLENPGKPV